MDIVDQPVRDAVMETQGNVAISASAGTGKTHTIIDRIARDIAKNNTYKTYAALTFTRKAAKEIRDRIGIAIGDGFIGTNDNFILQEVIQPFIRDAYGEEYNKKITPNYSTEQSNDSFSKLLKVIKNSDEGYICKYTNPKKNFGFELALNILQKSHVARRYLKSKYFRIYVDEYQDSDRDMHDFFLYISNTLQIPLFIVGDIKQSIYEWRGGYPEGFRNLIDNKNYHFTSYILKHNFRSNLPIQNYSNIFVEDVRSYYVYCNLLDEVAYIPIKNEIGQESLEFIKSWCRVDKTIAILVRVNDDGEKLADILRRNQIEMTFIPRSPLDDSKLESNHVWIARCVALYLLQKNYSEYSFYDEIPMPESFNIKELRSLLKAIESVRQDKNRLNENCKQLYNYLTEVIDEKKYEKEINKLFETISDPKYISTYNLDSYKHIVTTIHSAKGLQYDQVLIFTGDYFDRNQKFDEQLHYVAVTRAKEKLLILLNNSRYMEKLSECIEKTNERGFNIKLSDVVEKCL